MLFCSSSTCRVIAFHRIERSCFICSSNTQQYFINMYERGNKTNVCMCMWNDHDCSCGLRLYWENGEERETMRDEKWWFCMYVRMSLCEWMYLEWNGCAGLTIGQCARKEPKREVQFCCLMFGSARAIGRPWKNAPFSISTAHSTDIVVIHNH